jgi:hypothetical protein
MSKKIKNYTFIGDYEDNMEEDIVYRNPEPSSFVNTTDPKKHPYYSEYVSGTSKYGIYDNTNITNEASRVFKGNEYTNLKNRYLFFTPGERYKYLLSDESIQMMSNTITKKLDGIHPDGKNIIVPDYTIRNTAENMFEYNPMSVDVLQMMTINFIVDSIKEEYLTLEKNNSLSIWVTKYDDSTGLKRITTPKLNQKMRQGYVAWKY